MDTTILGVTFFLTVVRKNVGRNLFFIEFGNTFCFTYDQLILDMAHMGAGDSFDKGIKKKEQHNAIERKRRRRVSVSFGPNL